MDYTILNQWKLYLKRVNLNEAEMSEEQLREMRNCFFGAWGQALVLLREEVGVLPEKTAIRILESQMTEIGNFFIKENGQEN